MPRAANQQVTATFMFAVSKNGNGRSFHNKWRFINLGAGYMGSIFTAVNFIAMTLFPPTVESSKGLMAFCFKRVLKCHRSHAERNYKASTWALTRGDSTAVIFEISQIN